MNKLECPTTSNLGNFGLRERRMLVELLTAWDTQGLPNDFWDDEVTFMFNRNSGYVFLTNADFQVAMLNGDKWELWHNCFECGHEGFEETCQLNDDGCNLCAPQPIAEITTGEI